MNYRRAMVSSHSDMEWRSMAIFVIFILPQTISVVADLVPVRREDESLCKHYHRTTATVVSYTEMYLDHDRIGGDHRLTRINFRTEVGTKWEMMETCCPGYKPNEHAESTEACAPICPSNCVNGTCHRPNECICDPGYHVSINKLTNFSECLPNCSIGCQGGSCVQPEVCSCYAGYTLATDQRSCKASCFGVGTGGLRGCGEHASCIAPDTCKCDDGYAVSTSKTATIRDMFYITTTTAKPLDIASTSTFNNSDVFCKPVCDPDCDQTSSCIAPNKCQCNIGYKSIYSLGKHITCDPICEKPCFNGFCSSPNECTCNVGYKPHEVLGTIMCEPHCQTECVNAKCTKMNYCECRDGYEKLHYGVPESVCVPICRGNCPNGICVAPDQCHCNQGYSIYRSLANETATSIERTTNDSIDLRRQESCQPLCEPGCPSGSFCIAPNQCQIGRNNDRNYDGFPRNRTRVIHDTNDCGQGHFLMNNYRAVCLYEFNGTRCSEPNPCAIIVAGSPERSLKFIFLQRFELVQNLAAGDSSAAGLNRMQLYVSCSIIFLNNETKGSEHNMSKNEDDQKIKWWTPRCTDECRILIPSGGLSATEIYKEVINCYELEAYNVTTGLLFPTNMLPSSTGRNQSLLCFLKADDVVVGKNGHEISAIVGTIVALVLIIGIAVSIYLVQKRRRVSRFEGVSASSDTMTVQSELSQFNTEES